MFQTTAVFIGYENNNLNSAWYEPVVRTYATYGPVLHYYKRTV